MRITTRTPAEEPYARSMTAPASPLERTAVLLWREWGQAFAMFTRCTGCGELRQCRGRRRARMLCLDCHDQGKR